MNKQEYSKFWLENNEVSYTLPGKPWHKHRIDTVLNAIPKGLKVLDIACGNGEITGYLKEWRGCDVTGYEIGEAAITYAREKYKDINFIQGDVLQMPFVDNHFQYAHAGEIVEHLESPEVLIQDIARIVSEGAVITTPDRVVYDPQHIAVWTKQAFTDLLKEYFPRVEIINPMRTMVAVCKF